MSDEVVLDGLSGFVLFEDEWGMLQGNFYGLSTDDSACREVFNNLEDF